MLRVVPEGGMGVKGLMRELRYGEWTGNLSSALPFLARGRSVSAGRRTQNVHRRVGIQLPLF